MANAPARLGVSWEQFLQGYDEEGPLQEWVRGEVVMHVPASERHQAVVVFLTQLLGLFVSFFGLGRVLSAPFAMRLGPDGPAREPDLLFVAREHAKAILPGHLEGPADLAIEVVSDDSVARDRAEKFYEYQEGGVREYWVIDPRPGRERADFWLLGPEGRYRPVTPDADGVYRSSVVPGFWLRPAWLAATDLPDALLTFAEVAGFPPDMVATMRGLKLEGRPQA